MNKLELIRYQLDKIRGPLDMGYITFTNLINYTLNNNKTLGGLR